MPHLAPFATHALNALSACSAAALVMLPCLATAVPVEVTVLDAENAPLNDAVVSIEVKGVKPTAAAGTQAELAQRNRSFAPSVLPIQTGTSVQFPNLDTVRHHIYSFSATRPFEIKLYAGTPASPVTFDKAGTAVLGCNIHDRMTGFIHVVNTPYFAKTSASGMAKLDVPSGEHTVQVWHPSLADTRQPLRQPLKVLATGTQRLSLTLPANGASTPSGK
ncbi:methylamine utilization protein [Aquabacterium sp.]|jgi:plastocyanin|uniref:methylamine utilization protein n=1 Tax=Aquabacterium TaxID=92793 RepID=UPI0025C0A89E|nr:methylamine utilization protein [Aquabacterium sp.]|tara:strand:- start:343 stop:999 length:657 start_codon:yes stop_codon:yes gene_type:complete